MTACPLCGGETEPLLLRRRVPIVQNAAIRDREAARAVPRGTLDLRLCAHCHHAFNAAWDQALLRYDSAYENRQDCSAAFRDHLNSRLQAVRAEAPRGAEVIELGCGQGDFLAELCSSPGWHGQGFDPAVRRAAAPGCSFESRILEVGDPVEPVDLSLSRHVVEHVPDPVAFLSAVRHFGRAASFVETPDLLWIVGQSAYWDLFYEHVGYFTPRSLRLACGRAGWDHPSVQGCFGGQYLWCTRGVAVVSPAPEAAADDLDRIRGFAAEHDRWVERWTDLLRTLPRPIVVWGAGAKGATFAAVQDPDATAISAVIDISPAKQGAFLPGSGHPVLGPAALSTLQPRSVVVMNPAYRAEIAQDLHAAGCSATLLDP